MSTMRIAFGTDERTEITDRVKEIVLGMGHELEVVAEDVAWPEVGRSVGEVVAGGEADRGIVCCWTGTGVSIAANKVPGVRAALCTDAETADGARRWNDANVLALSLRLLAPSLADEIVPSFLVGTVDDDEEEAISRVE